MAAEAGVDLRTLNGSGPGGRIVKRDIEAAISQGRPAAAAAAETQTSGAVVKFPARQPGANQASAYVDEPVSEMRRIIAKRLVTSLGPDSSFLSDD